MRSALWRIGMGRRPQNPDKVPYQQILPLALKTRVSGKADSQSELACLHELSVLFASLKAHDFNESLCPKEVKNLKESYKTFLDRQYAMKMAEKKGLMAQGKTVNSKQLNKYLKSFPSK